MSNILVTGGAGYVGSVCCEELLRRGHSVSVVDNFSTGYIDAVPKGVRFYETNINDRRAIGGLLREQQFDSVFHFAAKALIPESIRNPAAFFENNLVASIAFAEELRNAGIRRFVFSSTAAVYGNPIEVPITEDHPKEPVNSYGESKLAFERVLRWYASAYGWSVVAFRYFNACGATPTSGERHDPETHIIPLLLQTAAGARERFEIYGGDYATHDGTCVRDYVHVVDIAAAHLLALKKMDVPGFHAYNIGNGTPFSVREVIRAVEQVTGKTLPVVMASRRPGDPAVLVASHAKLAAELGWKPQYSGLDEIVRSAWSWMLGQGHGKPAEQTRTAA
ncbi:MAG TPA: UDP-glucose 4-epimerase GalE [Clostridia bacterium]|nr:UDP-glucose 4-epimerase GalE [Clostridia bacterium]